MATSVRLFAAVREAAGSEWVTVEADTVAGMLEELADRYGEVMRRRVAVATVLVDGTSVPRGDTEPRLEHATEVVILPPFAGG